MADSVQSPNITDPNFLTDLTAIFDAVPTQEVGKGPDDNAADEVVLKAALEAFKAKHPDEIDVFIDQFTGRYLELCKATPNQPRASYFSQMDVHQEATGYAPLALSDDASSAISPRAWMVADVGALTTGSLIVEEDLDLAEPVPIPGLMGAVASVTAPADGLIQLNVISLPLNVYEPWKDLILKTGARGRPAAIIEFKNNFPQYSDAIDQATATFERVLGENPTYLPSDALAGITNSELASVAGGSDEITLYTSSLPEGVYQEWTTILKSTPLNKIGPAVEALKLKYEGEVATNIENATRDYMTIMNGGGKFSSEALAQIINMPPAAPDLIPLPEFSAAGGSDLIPLEPPPVGNDMIDMPSPAAFVISFVAPAPTAAPGGTTANPIVALTRAEDFEALVVQESKKTPVLVYAYEGDKLDSNQLGTLTEFVKAKAGEVVLVTVDVDAVPVHSNLKMTLTPQMFIYWNGAKTDTSVPTDSLRSYVDKADQKKS